MRTAIPLISAFMVAASLTGPATLAAEASTKVTDRPNILWLFAEDTSPWMGCYGSRVNAGQTPNIDALAAGGVRFSRAYVPAPVCSPCRSAMMCGQNQIRFGAHEHRSSRGPAKIELPKGVKLLPQLLKEAGYFTFNLGKTDYNFVWDQRATYSLLKGSRNSVPWDKLKQQQPFFGQIQTAGGKNKTDNFPADRKVDPNSVTVPADYPQDDVYRKVVAQHHDAIRKDDDFIGKVLGELSAAGMANNTIVVYFGDHGANNLVRHKQMPTEGGLHVPLIVNGPDPYVPAPCVRDDLVDLLDLSATTLAWAGVKIPAWYEGQFLFGRKVIPRAYVAAAKDRLDHTIDRVRTVRSDRYRYTRNYMTDRILLQPQYRDGRDFMVHLRNLYATGKLSPQLTEIYFGERPEEELYDVRDDPSQLHNLATDPTFATELQRHREYLDAWIAKGDAGAGEEPLEEIRYQAGGKRGHKWGRAVNPEYELVRQDNDGDGLSDDWEIANGRDPQDGKLLFRFDCGGWQTEGWHGSESLGNLAGRQGFLEFVLGEANSEIWRGDLKLQASQNTGNFVIKMKASRDTQLVLSATTGQSDPSSPILTIKVPKSDVISEQAAPLVATDHWNGSVSMLKLQWIGEPGTVIEIDSIAVR